MTSTANLSGSYLRTYNTLFQHPISHNLGWHDVHALLRKLGEVQEEPNGNLKVTCNGRSLVLHPETSKDVAEIAEIMALRKLVEPPDPAPAPQSDIPDYDLKGRPAIHTNARLLLIKHQEARLFTAELKGGIPERLLPSQPGELFRNTHTAQGVSRAKEKPEPNAYFEAIARALQGTNEVLVFGTGKGMSNEMDQFTGWVQLHHSNLAERISTCLVVDEMHQSDAELLELARDSFAARAGREA